MGSTFSNVYPSILNVAIVGIMATIWIALAKWFFTRYSVPGLSTLYASI